MVKKLTIAEADELILATCRPSDGAIEDCEKHGDLVHYFFESNVHGTVNRNTGSVTFQGRKAPNGLTAFGRARRNAASAVRR
jgi:hypothetical protein